MAGKMSREQFQAQLYHEWASVANPYTGIGKQGTGSTNAQMKTVLEGLKNPTATADSSAFAADTARRQQEIVQQQQQAAANANAAFAANGAANEQRQMIEKLKEIVDNQKTVIRANEEAKQIALINQAKGADADVTEMITSSTV
jgi:hypothetical protein